MRTEEIIKKNFYFAKLKPKVTGLVSDFQLMPQKFIHSLVVVFALSGLLVYSVQAQENIPNDPQEKEIKELNNHPELNLDDDKTLLMESDGQKPSAGQPIVKEAVTVNKSAKSKSDKAHPDKVEEDALSFNFLYYIIQKFKISDIVN